jgi:hypothetical protein
MSRTQKIFLFYALVILVAFDLNAISQRFFLANPDAIGWSKVVASAVLQGLLALGLIAYIPFLWRKSTPSSTSRFMLGPMGWKIVPLIALGILAAWSVAMLYNGFNCGSHPLPSARGAPLCPP